MVAISRIGDPSCQWVKISSDFSVLATNSRQRIKLPYSRKLSDNAHTQPSRVCMLDSEDKLEFSGGRKAHGWRANAGIRRCKFSYCRAQGHDHFDVSNRSGALLAG